MEGYKTIYVSLSGAVSKVSVSVHDCVSHHKVVVPVDVLQGAKGKDGVSVTSVDQVQTSTDPGGENIWRMTLSDGTTHDFSVRNGSGGGSSVEVVQTTGDSTTSVMSQRAVTNTIDTTVGNINALLGTI